MSAYFDETQRWRARGGERGVLWIEAIDDAFHLFSALSSPFSVPPRFDFVHPLLHHGAEKKRQLIACHFFNQPITFFLGELGALAVIHF
jgi:hypothetical protein